MCFSSFRLLLKLLEKRKFFDTQIGKRKTNFSMYNINFNIFPAFFAFVVNLIKPKLETVSIIFFHQRLSLCCQLTLWRKNLNFSSIKLSWKVRFMQIYRISEDIQINKLGGTQKKWSCVTSPSNYVTGFGGDFLTFFLFIISCGFGGFYAHMNIMKWQKTVADIEIANQPNMAFLMAWTIKQPIGDAECICLSLLGV